MTNSRRTEPSDVEDPKPNDIALEEPTPELLEDLEQESEHQTSPDQTDTPDK